MKNGWTSHSLSGVNKIGRGQLSFGVPESHILMGSGTIPFSFKPSTTTSLVLASREEGENRQFFFRGQPLVEK